MKTSLPDYSLQIHPISQDEVDAVLDLYRQCEDFLALGPAPTASVEMVLKGIEISKDSGGVFCGIYMTDGRIIGVIDYVPSNYEGKPDTAFLELLLIGPPFRNQGIGKAVVEAFESEIRKDPKISTILSGVQVNNLQAMKSWQRNGYRIVSGSKLHPDQTTAVDLRKDLSQRV